jgi:hypothetical protein
MGRKSKDVFGYATGLWQIVEAVALRNERLEIVVESVQKARKMRGKFYAFRQGLESAIREAGMPDSAHAANLGQLQDTLQWARSTVCWFDDATEAGQPVRVWYMHKDATPDADLYRQALASAKGLPPTQSETDAMAASAARVAELAGLPPPKDNPYY